MPLPSLPQDVWFRLSTFMDPPSLSALSQVNRSLNEIATDETHFQRHLPVSPSEDTHVLQLYRRMCALKYTPNHVSTVPLSTKLTMLCVAHDNLLLLDVSNARLLAFPSGLTVHAEEIIGKISNPRTRTSMLNQLEGRAFQLPNAHIGFTSGFQGSRLSVLDLKSGRVITHKLRRRRKAKRTVVNGKSVLAAGVNAEWILFRVDESTLEIVDWRDGKVVRQISTVNEDIKFVIGECPAVDGTSVVGLVHKKADGSVNEVLVKGFDGVEMKFQIAEEKQVYSVLRSADKKTHVLITAASSRCIKPAGFMANRKYDAAEKWWSGSFKPTMSYPELQENGRIISFTQKPILGKVSYTLSPWLQWIELKEADAAWGKAEALAICTLTRKIPVWTRRTRDGALAVMARKREGFVDFVRIVKEREKDTAEDLKSWKIENISNVCVVADHFVVVTSSDLKLHLLHFDKFCNGGSGVYACPLVGLVTYCYFPEHFRERDEDSHRHKRRRISDDGLTSEEELQ